MLNFRGAYIYVKNNSSYDIFVRVVPYQVLTDIDKKNHKHIKKTFLSILIASLCGPFNIDNMDDPNIKDLLTMTDYGYHSRWESMLEQWGRSHCNTSTDLNYFSELVKIINQKLNTIGDYLDAEMTKPTPAQYYIHEIIPFGHLDPSWPRI